MTRVPDGGGLTGRDRSGEERGELLKRDPSLPWSDILCSGGGEWARELDVKGVDDIIIIFKGRSQKLGDHKIRDKCGSRQGADRQYKTR